MKGYFKYFGLLIAAFLGGAVANIALNTGSNLIAQDAPKVETHDVIRAKRIELVDDAGTVRILQEVDRRSRSGRIGAARIVIANDVSKKDRRILLESDGAEQRLEVNTTGKASCGVRLSSGARGSFWAIRHDNKSPLVMSYVTPDGKKNKASIGITSTQSHRAGLGGSGVTRLAMSLRADETVALSLSNPKGRIAAEIEAGSEKCAGWNIKK